MVNIFANFMPNYVVKSTDFKYLDNFKKLSKELDAEFYFPKSNIWGLKENIYAVINKILRIARLNYKISYKYPKETLGKEFNPAIYDIVYSQAYCPKNTYGVPVYLESGFWLPGQNSRFSEQAKDKFENFTVPYFREILQYPCVINLKSNQEIENARKYFPEYKNRFVNLPFLLPNLKSITSEECKRKHLSCRTINILFVGGEAKRKGLPELLAAYMEFCEENPSIITKFHIVSGFNDGKIEIPVSENIIVHGALPFEDTQRLMQDCQIFAMVSKRESYGWVYLESLSKGCVTIVRDYYPQKEFIDYGKCGLSADPYNKESIKDAIKTACTMTNDERYQMGLRAISKFNECFHIDVVVPRYKYMFNNINSLLNGH